MILSNEYGASKNIHIFWRSLSNALVLINRFKGTLSPNYLKEWYTALDTDHYVIGLFSIMQQIMRKQNLSKFPGDSVCLKSGYRKRKGGLKTGYRKRIRGPKSGYGNKKGVSNMVTEEKKGLKYGYGNKLGVSNMVTDTNWDLKNDYGKLSSVTIFENSICFCNHI